MSGNEITIHIRDAITARMIEKARRDCQPVDVVCDNGAVVRAVVKELHHERLQQTGYLSGVIDRWTAVVVEERGHEQV